MIFLRSVYSEWLKTRKSNSFWFTVVGGIFIPVLAFIKFIYTETSINTGIKSDIWKHYFGDLWHMMAGLLLPFGVILASSMISQIEYRNNSWKQLLTTPQSYIVIFHSKLSILFLMMLQFFIIFNVAIIVSGMLSSLIIDGYLPKEAIPIGYFVKENIKYFIACMPIVAIQYLISLHFKSFLVSIGIGFVALIGTAMSASWKYILLSPFAFEMIAADYKRFNILPTFGYNIYALALLSFLVITIINYFIYSNRKIRS